MVDSKYYYLVQLFQLFMNAQIVIAIVGSSFYFYFTSMYTKKVAEIKKDDKLHYLIYQEVKDDGEVHKKVLKYIVDTHMDNPEHDFSVDEWLGRLKQKYENEEGEANMAAQAEERFLLNFSKLNWFRKTWAWRITLLVFDVAIFTLTMVFTDYYYMDVSDNIKKLNGNVKDTDRAGIAKSIDTALDEIEINNYIILSCCVCSIVNLFLRALTLGLKKGLFGSFGTGLNTIVSAGIFS